MFSTENDTPYYAVCVDGYFGLFTDKESAIDVYMRIGSIDDSPFGCAQFLPPHFKPKFIDGSLPESKLSEHKSIDIAKYINNKLFND